MRWLPYGSAWHLRDGGYDIFTFDFRNHGSSGAIPSTPPCNGQPTSKFATCGLHWLTCVVVPTMIRLVSDWSVSAGEAARIGRGSEESDVWGVVTDGAFPTRGTITAYMFRWAEIFVRSRTLLKLFPGWLYSFLGWLSLLASQRRLKCRFPDIETAARRLSPRPWLMIHGERDVYISPEIARSLFERPATQGDVAGARGQA